MTDHITIQAEAHKAWEEPSIGDRFYCDRHGTRKILTVTKVLNTRVVLGDGSYINLKSRKHSENVRYFYWYPVTPAVEAGWAEDIEKEKASEGLRDMVLEVQAKVAKLPTRDLKHWSVEANGALRTKLEAILAVLAES